MFLLGSTWDGRVFTISKITAMQSSESKLACRMLQSSPPPEQTLFIVKSLMALDSGVVAHALNPSSPKAKAGSSLSLRLAWSTEGVLGQPRLHIYPSQKRRGQAGRQWCPRTK